MNTKNSKRGNKGNNGALIRYPPLTKPYRLTCSKGLCAPDEFRTTLRYSRQFTINIAAGVAQSYLFRGNGPFDPDQTGTGGQPNGYDQWSAFYTSQVTLGSKIVVKPLMYPVAGETGEVVVAPIVGSGAVSVTTDINNLKSGKYAKWDTITPFTQTSVTSVMSSAEILGKSLNAIENDDTFGSNIGALPITPWDWEIAVNMTGATSTGPIIVIVEVDYDILFWGRVNLVLS